MKERVNWIDISKFFGIFAIYLGHFGTRAGDGYPFVFKYHVALFFLLSGCMSTYDKEPNIMRFLVKKFKAIMIPFWIFCMLSIIVNVLYNNAPLNNIKEMLIIVAKGNIRNSFFADPLWFLTCLFLMEIIFKMLKCIKNKWIMFVICLNMFIIAEKLINPRPIVEPHWFYNLDSVFYYIIFFAIGYIIYPHVLNLFKLDTLLKKILFIVTGGICFIYSALLFLGKDYITPMLNNFPIVSMFTPILSALLIIWLNLVIAKLFENITLFSELGRNSLYLCGNEYIVKTLMSSFLQMFGLGITLSSPLFTYLYTLLLLIICVKIIIPFEKRLIDETKAKFK